MNLSRLYLISFLLLALGASAKSQKPPKAILIDEFPRLHCEDVIARQDNLFVEVQTTPNSVGYAIIFADNENRTHARRTESMFHGHTQFRRFDDARFKVIRAVGAEGLRVQLWIIPRGTPVPEFQPTEWDFKIDPPRKPSKFNASEYDEGPCPIGSQFQLYSDYLKANPDTRGHIVIWARTSAQFHKEKERIHRDFLTKYSIDDDTRIRYFYFRHRSTYIKWEYWIVPKRNT